MEIRTEPSYDETHATSTSAVYGRLWASAKVAAPVLLGLILAAPSPLSAAESVCNGTLLQIQVNERGTTRSDRFRFLLRLEAENASKDIAMTTLNARLAKARQAIQSLVLGRLTTVSYTHLRAHET